MKRWLSTTVVVAFAMAAPVSAQSAFMTFEDARLMAAREVAVTPSVSTFGDDIARFGSLFGARVTFGVADRANLSVSFERFSLTGDAEGANVMSVGVKLPIKAGQLAILARRE